MKRKATPKVSHPSPNKPRRHGTPAWTTWRGETRVSAASEHAAARWLTFKKRVAGSHGG